MKKAIDILRAHESAQASTWQQEAQEHIESWPWMKYSMRIAIKVRSRMKDLGMTQSDLAHRIGCTQQYISLLLKGRENLTLETISKLESALDVMLFDTTSNIIDGYAYQIQRRQYLSDNTINNKV